MKAYYPHRQLFIHLSYFLLYLGLSIFPGYLMAQSYLLIEKPGKVKNIKLQPGDDLTFMLRGETEFRTATIARLTDSTIILGNGFKITLKSVSKVRKERWGMNRLYKVSGIAGIGYLILDVFNNGINGTGPLANQHTLIVSGILLTTAVISYKLSKRTMVMGHHWRLQVMDLQNPPMLK
ncbi:MAG: hypothetical protein WCO63_01975 [Bacteroidota bacterium]